MQKPMFKKGDRVVCIRPDSSYLVRGHHYTVFENYYEGRDCFVRLEEISNPFFEHRFELVTKSPEELVTEYTEKYKELLDIREELENQGFTCWLDEEEQLSTKAYRDLLPYFTKTETIRLGGE